MANKVLILGRGFIGRRLEEGLGYPIIDDRINSLGDVQNIIQKYKPDVLLNCIGFSGAKNVDGCEEELEKTIHANAFVPLWLAEGCLRNNIKLVHISSGCIYHYHY